MTDRDRKIVEVAGVAVIITLHFQDRWEERVGGRLDLPLNDLVNTFMVKPEREYRTRIPNGACVILNRGACSLSLITVIVGVYNGTLPWTPLASMWEKK